MNYWYSPPPPPPPDLPNETGSSQDAVALILLRCSQNKSNGIVWPH